LNENKDQTISVSATSFTPSGRRNIDETVCRELPMVIKVNSQEIATMLCSPNDLEDLVFGLLYSEGFIKNVKEITDVDIDTSRAEISVKTTGEVKPQPCLKPLIATGGSKGQHASGGVVTAADEKLFVSCGQISTLMNNFLNASQVYSATRGIHSAAVASPEQILVRRDDIGRHNALDKALGSCLRSGIQSRNHLVIISGRVSSEMLLKVAAHHSPFLLTKAVPTDMGIDLAKSLGITLVRCSQNLNVTAYCHDWRVAD